MKTAREFLKDEKDSVLFREFCALAGIEPTRRQVRKFRRREGSAYKASLNRSPTEKSC